MAKDIAFEIGPSSIRRTENRRTASSLFQRFTEALRERRRRAVEREVAQFIQRNGGRLTDELEREISRRFGGMAGS